MAEHVQLPARHHTRAKSTHSDTGNDRKDAPVKPRISRTKSKQKIDSTASDEATAAFVRRSLCAHQIRSGPAAEAGKPKTTSLEELLPPLTTSNKIDLQLYALIAIIIRDFVQTWYSRITPDQQFTDQVVQIIAHCTRALEERIRHVDIEALAFDEIPAILDAHIATYRTACGGLFTSMLGTETHELYHAIHPHPALSPVPSVSNPSLALEQAENERVWRQLLIQAALTLLLPPEDLENPCLRVLVADILSELILGNTLCGKVCEGWFIWEIITKVIALTRPAQIEKPEPAKPVPEPSRLEKFGLLPEDKLEETSSSTETNAGPIDAAFLVFWQIIRYSTLAFFAIRAFVVVCMDPASLPIRRFPEYASSSHMSSFLVESETKSEVASISTYTTGDRPILGMSAWNLCCRILSIDLRMPWLTAICDFIRWLLIYGPGGKGRTNSTLDRLLSHQIATTILNPDYLPSLLLTVRTTLFPNNSLGPGRVPPSEDEALGIRRQCACAILDALPPIVRLKLFGSGSSNASDGVADGASGSRDSAAGAAASDAAMQGQVEDMLDVFGNAYLNKHMLFALVDLVFARLFPEIQRQSISAILDVNVE